MTDLKIKGIGWNESTIAEDSIRCTNDGQIVAITPIVMDLEQLRKLIKNLQAIEREMSRMTYIGKDQET
jgi:hypothetical protein